MSKRIELPDIVMLDGFIDEGIETIYIYEEDLPKLKKWLIEYEMNEP